MYSTLRLNMK